MHRRCFRSPSVSVLHLAPPFLQLEQEVEGIPAILDPEKLHQQAEHDHDHPEPEIHPEALLGRRRLRRNEHRERDDGEPQQAV